MHITTFSSKVFDGCIKTPLVDDRPDEVILKGDIAVQEVSVPMIKQARHISANVVDDEVDIEVIFDYSGQVFPVSVYMNRVDTIQRSTGKRDVNRTQLTNVPPQEIDLEYKNQGRIRFKNLKKDNYNFFVYQPKDLVDSICQSKVSFTVITYPPMDDQAMLE